MRMPDEQRAATGSVDSSKTISIPEPPSTPNASSDASLFTSADRMRQTVPWALRDEVHEKERLDAALATLLDREDYGQAEVDALVEAHAARYSARWYREALTEAQIADLSERFVLPEAMLMDLSRRLAVALTPELEPVLVRVPRAEAEKQAAEVMGEACDRLMKASEEAVKAFELVEVLTLSGSASAEECTRFAQARRDHDQLLLDIERLYHRYQATARRSGLLLDLEALDRRTVGDPRRRKILFLLFEAWAAAGRPLSITTDAIDNSQRKGLLIAFVNAVILCITEPASELSGETIWMDMKLYKATLARS